MRQYSINLLSSLPTDRLGNNHLIAMAKPAEVFFTPTVMGIVKVVLVLLGFWFLFLIRDVVLIVIVALLLASLIDPFADSLQKRHLPRSIAVLLIYVLLLGLVTLLVSLLVPPLRHDIPQLISNLSGLWQRFGHELLNIQSLAVERGFVADVQQNIDFVGEGFDRLLVGAFSTIRGAIGFVAGLIVSLVMAFYLVVEEDAVKKFVRDLAPSGVHTYLSDMFSRVQDKIGAWLRGQLLLSMVIGLLVYIALTLLQVKAALALALLAAFAEFIPYVGPVFAAIPSVALGFADAPIKGILVVGVYVIIQQFENNFLVPKVMQRAIGLNPIVSIIALLVGARMGGFLGALLAIPLATSIAVFVNDYVSVRRERADRES